MSAPRVLASPRVWVTIVGCPRAGPRLLRLPGEQKNPGATPRNLVANDPAAALFADSVSSTFPAFCAAIGGVPVDGTVWMEVHA